MVTLILFFVFYIIPATISYFGIRYQFMNEWKGLNPDLSALAMVFVPLLNIGYAIFSVMNIAFTAVGETLDGIEKSKINKKMKEKKFGKKFFKIK